MNKVPTDWCLRELFPGSWKNLFTLSSQDRSEVSLESPLQRQESHSGHLITSQWPHLLTLTLWRPEFQCLSSEQINTYSTIHTIFFYMFLWVSNTLEGPSESWSISGAGHVRVCLPLSLSRSEGWSHGWTLIQLVLFSKPVVKLLMSLNPGATSFWLCFSWIYKQLSLQWIKMTSLQWVALKTNWINVLKQLQFFWVCVCVVNGRHY